MQHDQRLDGIGGAQRAWLQYAQGSAALDANFGTMTAKPAVAQWRVVESLTWQSGAFGGQAVALYGRHDADPAHGIAARYAELSIGARASYAVSPNIKLVTEAGHMEKRLDGSGTQRLTKLTLAPTWSAGPGFSGPARTARVRDEGTLERRGQCGRRRRRPHGARRRRHARHQLGHAA